jgi:hypothetical protein
MDEFLGAFGDKRRSAAVARLHEQIVVQSSLVVRKLGVDRGGELSAHRVLSSARVTPQASIACMSRRTGQAVCGRRVVVAQDTSEVNFAGRQSRGLGPAGRAGDAPGFFIHAGVAVDVQTEAVLGLVDAQIWTRTQAVAAPHRRERVYAEKESQRWLDMAAMAAERLGQAQEIVVVGDRESDIYALFARRPASVQVLIRAAQDRSLADGALLFATAAAWPGLATQTLTIPPRRPGEKGRTAVVTLRAGRVMVRHPRHGRREGDAETLSLMLVEARETDPPEGAERVHWRLLTTLDADTPEQAAEVVRLYRLRWRIEQTFRMLKSDGLRIEEVQTAEPHRLFNLAALAIGAAVRIIQLVDARDGSSRPAGDVADTAQIAAAKALGPTLEGKTERQKNPHPPGSLAWLSWIVARLGGWNCYYKPPGPKTMRDGWQRFTAIAQGFALSQPATHNVRIP